MFWRERIKKTKNHKAEKSNQRHRETSHYYDISVIQNLVSVICLNYSIDYYELSILYSTKDGVLVAVAILY